MSNTTLHDEVMTSMKPDYEKEIVQIIRTNVAPAILREKLDDYHTNDIADVLPDLTLAERKKIYRILDPDMISDILEYAEEEDAGKYLNEMDIKKASKVLGEMEPDAVVDILKELSKDKRSLMIESLDEEAKRDFALISSYDEDEIGSKMTTNCIVIRENLTIKEAMTALVEQASSNDNISTIFVVEADGSFYGAIDLKDLIIARREQNLEDLIMTSYPYVYGNEEIDDCIENLKDYSEDLIPVLDNNNRLLGVITSMSIIEVVDEEMGEDYAMFAGLTAEEDLKEPLKDSMRKRLPWLLILLGLGLVVSSVVGIFEQVVSQLTLIMAFQSLILDMAGNTGTQTLAVTIRVLTDETLTGKQKLQFVFKEMKVGFSDGLILAIISVGLVGVYIMVFKDRPADMAFAISGCIGIALLIASIIASIIGSCIPMFFKKIGVDPAVASGPLITTVNDLIAVVTYYGLSWILLINVLHLAG